MVVGITGGIGSGKTTVVNEFKKLGVPCYVADIEAKKMMITSKELQSKIVLLLGEEAYDNGVLNRAYIADKVFKDKDLLQKLNAIVHPAVHKHFKDFVTTHKSDYCLYESAILFENKNQHLCDKVLVVIADFEKRIERVIERDGIGRELVLERMNNQWSQEEKVKKADYTILNDDRTLLEYQVLKLHQEFLSL